MASNSIVCAFCQRGKEAQSICGKLWKSKKKKEDGLAAHHKCMQYSSGLAQYTSREFGGFKEREVRKEIERGRGLKCNLCKDEKDNSRPRGATSGCAVKKCNQKFHFYCAAQDNKAFIRRLVGVDQDGDNLVFFRVYCSEKHLQIDEAQLKKERKVLRSSTDSEDYSLSESDSDFDDILPPTPKRVKKDECSTTNGHSVVVDASGDNQMKPCVLCLLECQTVHPNTKDTIDAFAARLYDTPSESVILWPNEHFPFLLPHHMIFMFKDISSAIREKRMSDLSHLLFSLTEGDVSSYEGVDREVSLTNEYKEVQENFVAAKQNVDGTEVGRLKKIKELRTWVMFVVLNSSLDPSGKLRQELLRSHCLFSWTTTSFLKSSFEGSAVSSEETRETELHTFESYLTELIPSLHVLSFPSDAFLRSSNKTSVSQLLYNLLEPLQDSKSKDCIAFLGPVETKLLDHQALVVSCMQWLIEEHLSKANSRVLCVFDVGVQFEMIRTVDMLCDLPDGVNAQILSALKPEIDPVSCVLVELTCK